MAEEVQMVKDIIVQLLNSPDWQNQCQSFVLENCIYFDEAQESSVDQQQIFKQYQRTMAVVYDSFFESVGMDDESLEKIQAQVISQLIKEGQKLVVSLKAIMDFQVFKAEMARWNKQLDLQAYHELNLSEDDDEEQEDIELGEDENDNSFEEMLELENAEEELNLQIALLMSLEKNEQDAVVQHQIEILNQKKDEITGRKNKVKDIKLTDEKLPSLDQLQIQQNQTDQMGFSIQVIKDNLIKQNDQQFESPIKVITQEELNLKKQKATEERMNKLKQKQTEKQQIDEGQQKKEPNADEIKKRKAQAALIKNVISQNDQ